MHEQYDELGEGSEDRGSSGFPKEVSPYLNLVGWRGCGEGQVVHREEGRRPYSLEEKQEQILEDKMGMNRKQEVRSWFHCSFLFNNMCGLPLSPKPSAQPQDKASE